MNRGMAKDEGCIQSNRGSVGVVHGAEILPEGRGARTL
jgi:hypothetical protein